MIKWRFESQLLPPHGPVSIPGTSAPTPVPASGIHHTAKSTNQQLEPSDAARDVRLHQPSEPEALEEDCKHRCVELDPEDVAELLLPCEKRMTGPTPNSRDVARVK